jgi:TniQ
VTSPVAFLRPLPHAPARTRLELQPWPQALPRRVQPFPDETTESYLGRVAAASNLDTEDLRRYLAREKRARSAALDIPALAVLAGVSEAALRHAMPELSSARQLAALGSMLGRPRPRFAAKGLACRSCAAIRCGGQAVTRWQTHENVICQRHRLWTHVQRGGTAAQLDLRDHPGILAANRLHRRLIRRLGRTTVHAAFESARLICNGWRRYSQDHRTGMDSRINALRGKDTDAHAGDPAVAAAIYRQQVALTRLLASPAWIGPVLLEHPGTNPDTVAIGEIALDLVDEEIMFRRAGDTPSVAPTERQMLREAVLLGAKPGTRQFVNEVRRTVAPEYTWLPFSANNNCEPLTEWIKDQVRARGSLTGLGYHWPPPDEAFMPKHLAATSGKFRTPGSGQLS